MVENQILKEEELDDKNWTELIKSADKNGDGKLTYTEFKDAI